MLPTDLEYRSTSSTGCPNCARENATGGLTGEGERGSQGGEGEREEEQKSWREVCHGVVTKRAPAALTVRLTCCMFYVRVSETVGE